METEYPRISRIHFDESYPSPSKRARMSREEEFEDEFDMDLLGPASSPGRRPPSTLGHGLATKRCPRSPMKTPSSARRGNVLFTPYTYYDKIATPRYMGADTACKLLDFEVNPDEPDAEDDEEHDTSMDSIELMSTSGRDSFNEGHLLATPSKRSCPRSCPRSFPSRRMVVPRGPMRVVSVEKTHINPFSPNHSMSFGGSTASTSSADTSLETILSEGSIVSRYLEDFEELEKIGQGSYATVTSCRKRLDGIVYAIKRIDRKTAGELTKEDVLREVYALSALDCPNIVRYYNAWFEDDQLYMQMEFCELGNLATRIGDYFEELELRNVLYQMCTALHCMHSHNLVHLDVKNANIFVQSDGTYKLGDLGQTVLAEVEEPRTVEEGDGKYLCRTLLEEDSRFFIQADIFSLGASVYELARQCELESGGQKWHDLRDGHLEPLPNYSEEFVSILGSMMHPDPLSRPSAGELLLHPYFQREDVSHTQSLLERIRILEGEVSRLKAVEACVKRTPRSEF